jgi:His/Glu/Gln/Arg/opine family amino acid ABC transporter permease subunit
MQTQTALDARSARRRRLLRLGRRGLIALAWALLIALLIVGVAWVFGMEWKRFKPLFVPSTLRFLLIGAVATIVVSLAAILLSLPLATGLALGRLASRPWLRYPTTAFIEVLRSLPLLLLIYYVNLRFPGLDVLNDIRLGAPNGFLNIVVTTILSQEGMAVVVALTLYTAAVNAELLRSGILSLDSGQTEASRSLGLGYWQTMRHIVLPQAYRRTLAPLIAQFTILVKDTSLGAIIGFIELLRRARIIFQRDGNPLEALYLAALIYFVINYALGLSAKIVRQRGPSVDIQIDA